MYTSITINIISNLTFVSRKFPHTNSLNLEALYILQLGDQFLRNKDTAEKLDTQDMRIGLFLFAFAHPLPNGPFRDNIVSKLINLQDLALFLLLPKELINYSFDNIPGTWT